MSGEILAAVVIADVLMALIPAMIARRKGRSALGFWLFGLVSFLPALVVAMVISKPVIRTGDLVKLKRDISLDNGTTIYRGWASKAHELDVIDGTAVVRILGPAGTAHWVAKDALRTA